MSIIDQFDTIMQSNDTHQLQEFVKQHQNDLVGNFVAMQKCIQNQNVFALDLVATKQQQQYVDFFGCYYNDNDETNTNYEIIKCLLKHECIDSKQFANYCESYLVSPLGMVLICHNGVNINYTHYSEGISYVIGYDNIDKLLFIYGLDTEKKYLVNSDTNATSNLLEITSERNSPKVMALVSSINYYPNIIRIVRILKNYNNEKLFNLALYLSGETLVDLPLGILEKRLMQKLEQSEYNLRPGRYAQTLLDSEFQIDKWSAFKNFLEFNTKGNGRF